MSARPAAPRLLPAAEVLFEAADGGHEGLDALAAALGIGSGPVRADHLRYKPDRTVVGRLNADDGAPVGWVAGFGPAAADKAAGAWRLGEKLGIDLPALDLGGGHLLIAGPVGADKKLRRLLRRTRSVRADGSVRGEILNFNPGRRLVVRRRGPVEDVAISGPDGDVVVKLSHRAYGHIEDLTSALRACGVPALQPHPMAGAQDHGLVFEHYGTGDLSAGGTADEFEQAGHLLRRWHAAGASVAAVTALPRLDASARLRAVVSGIEGILPEAADRARRVAADLNEALAAAGGADVPVHGDYSADQLLRGPAGLRIIDADRAAWGPPGWDLGCFAAAELLAVADGRPRRLDGTENMLHGYGGVESVPAFVGAHVLLRALEPFRAADPRWAERVSGRLALAERLAAAPAAGGPAALTDAMTAAHAGPAHSLRGKP
ncbi:phosphotransferase [Zhihengliuella halotolerans]|uniref:Ser/Thr protein kinase RdoA (MazF antagonist) n=1 Tax=Zhihengliuella halotolerans TaxID=370736 RepID=A0A4Q8AB21_9MICC|nr:phosphotransferase [Zhihengliuella halotolerans]RZU60709.1 Ser/Thr protein kinase RdoA (MazF antagonist) [Zhihengliuella halotolerans]